jgi:hypothetical protein
MQVFLDYIVELNWLAVVAAALAAFISGAVWYSKNVFGKQWQKAVGLTDKEIKGAKYSDILALALLANIVLAIAMAMLVQVLVLDSAYQGILLGIMVAVGLIGAHMFMQVNFERRPLYYWFIELGAAILSLSIMGGILAVWQLQ